MVDPVTTTFRPATCADSTWLKELHKAAYAVLSGQLYDERADAWQRGFFAARIAHPTDLHIISSAGTDVGAVYLERRSDGVFVESLEVLPEHQGRGIGSTALGWAVRRAEESGHAVTLQVHKANPRARQLYARHGFTVVGETETHLTMRTAPQPDQRGADERLDPA